MDVSISFDASAALKLLAMKSPTTSARAINPDLERDEAAWNRPAAENFPGVQTFDATIRPAVYSSREPTNMWGTHALRAFGSDLRPLADLSHLTLRFPSKFIPR
jgi:hypothetical protein